MTVKRSTKTFVLVVVALLVAGGAFRGGMLFQNSKAPASLADMGTRAAGGPVADMTEEERAEFESMTNEERQAWFEKNGGATMGAGNGGPVRGGNLEGEVIEYAGDTLTLSVGDSGSQTVYLDEDTVIAYAEGAGELAAGSTVMVMATPAADSVTTASLVVVK